MSGLALWVAVAGAGGCGAVLRLLVDEVVRGRAAGPFPLGILTVNVSGALLLGILTGSALPHDASLVAGTAFVGAYTTFSTWMLDTVNAVERRGFAVAAANLLGGMLLGLVAAAIGRHLGIAL